MGGQVAQDWHRPAGDGEAFRGQAGVGLVQCVHGGPWSEQHRVPGAPLSGEAVQTPGAEGRGVRLQLCLQGALMGSAEAPV